MNSNWSVFREPSRAEKVFNRIFGFLVGIGLGFSYTYLLEVRGRKSGKLYSTPINLLERQGQAIPGGAARAHAVGSQRRGCR